MRRIQRSLLMLIGIPGERSAWPRLSQVGGGTDARRVLGAAAVLWAGEVEPDGLVKYTGVSNDRDPILQAIGGTVPTNSISGYLRSDVNMDGTVKYTGGGNDRDPILQNVGGVVPTATRLEQLP